MASDPNFHLLVERVRAGDEVAAAEVVRLYEPEIRRMIRIRHTDPRLRRTVDSVDICQSVLANFFVRAAAGQFELDSPEQLLKLLVRMAQNKLFDKARSQRAERRNHQRLETAGQELLGALPATGDTPSQVVALRELLVKLRANLSDDERRLADLRAEGRNWEEIAAESGETPEALRKRLSRAIDRVAPQLGLSEVDDA